ncbi:MAG: T9SS type A sorting domain-containing protein [Ignavibacteriota bacterium]|nr:T9SS type A sorting domain-containing protein [Ignavibacteriales bacterium]MBL1122277.1 T9SS C-terminal target domain-containing protein [Ignavibacteriota bacterium]QKJ95404.1 MAG: T9SS type A sorting domain-containing protein [Ignavibacteriota bacterium]GIK59816.1 MAG: hypothetical protein BroJett017_07060 [Ignavibacteriota bacterium]
MKSILRLINLSLLVIFIFQCNTNMYSSNYYIDGDLTTGSNNGTSWANAWQSISAINWGSINPGDVIFFSGGTDSTIYHESLSIGASGSWKKYVYILPGKYAPNPNGHSGRVILDGDSVRSTIVTIDGRRWVYIKGLETRHGTGRGWNIIGATRHIVIDSVYNYEHSDHHMAIIGNAWGDDWIGDNDSTSLITDIEIKNCVMYGYKNHTNPGADDLIIIDAAQQININNNFLHIQNQQIGTPPGQHKHIDPLQTIEVKSVKIWNNVCIVDSGCYGHTMILGMQSGNGGADTNIIYNNFLYEGGHLNADGNPSVQELYLRWYGQGPFPPTFVINNTIVGANGGTYPLYHERPAWVKNNIIVQLGTNGQNPANYGGVGRDTWQGGWNTSWYNEADNSNNNLIWRDYSDVEFGGNRFMGSGGSPVGTPNGWSGWTNNYGGVGVNANPGFTGNYRLGKFEISENSPARNAGEDLQSFIESKGLPWTDINGNPRDSSPDLGAYEYTETHGDLGSNSSYTLSQNYPNPFNPTTAIEYYTAKSSQVKLVVYDMIGQIVQTLVNGEKASGSYEVVFNGNNLTSGVYFYRLEIANFAETKKMMLLK